jgi:hypothetical protein
VIRSRLGGFAARGLPKHAARAYFAQTAHIPPSSRACGLIGNSGEYGGGAIGAYQTTPTITTSTFEYSNARWGTAAYTSGAASLVNVTFAGNVARESGNGVYNTSSPDIISSVLWDADFGEEIHTTSTGITVECSDVRGLGGGTNIDADLLAVLSAWGPCP